MPSFDGTLLTHWHDIWSQKATYTTLSYGENLESHLYLTWVWFGTGSWRTDGQTELR